VLRLVVLDVNETLFPLDPVVARMAQVGLAGRFDAWFARVLRDGIAAAAAGRYASFGDLASHHLQVLLTQHQPSGAAGGPAAPGPRSASAAEAVDHVLAGFEDLVPAADVAPGLRALRSAGIRAVTLTNGSAALTRRNLDRAGLAALVHAVHDVAEVGRWKPAPEPYRSVLAAHAIDPADAAMVAVHAWDVLGGQAVGMVGAWLDRSGTSSPAVYGAPDVAATDLPSLVERLVERSPPPRGERRGRGRSAPGRG
jgi:2-haloacid dehalogenase